jgi:hypothetical protein
MVPKHAGGRPPKEPWSAAYLRTCPEGHKYTPKERTCPECGTNPEQYMRKALALTAGGGGWLSYTGRNWLAGRKL